MLQYLRHLQDLNGVAVTYSERDALASEPEPQHMWEKVVESIDVDALFADIRQPRAAR